MFHRMPNDQGQCVLCGWCCTIRSCGYGEWDEVGHKCRFLAKDNRCLKYDEIIRIESLAQNVLPMFGCGCSSTLCNSVRQAKLKSLLDGNNGPSETAIPPPPRGRPA